MGAARDLNRIGDTGGVVVHYHDIGRLNGCVRAQPAHGDPYIGSGERWRVVDTVSHKRNRAHLAPAQLATALTAGLLVHYGLKRLDLLPGKQVGTVFVYAYLARNLLGDMAHVAGKHDDPVYACVPEPSNAVQSSRFHLIGQAYPPCQNPVFSHIDHSAVGNTHVMRHVLKMQKPIVAGHDTLAGYCSAHAHPAYLIDSRDGRLVDRPALLPAVAV